MQLKNLAKKIARRNVGKHTKSKAAKNLPALFFFTDRKKIPNWPEIVLHLPREVAIIVREYDLDESKRLNFIREIQKLTAVTQPKIIVGKSYSLAISSGADGVHYSDLDRFNYKILPPYPKKNFIFTCSCHSELSLKKLQNKGFDMIFYSPIFATNSHPDSLPIGVAKLAKITNQTKIPIAALGGVNQDNIRQLLNGAKIQGIAGINFFADLSRL